MARILIVEDNEASLEMLARRLSKKGHAVTTAMDGETGWSLARGERFDVIVLDIGLPDINGYEWARRAKGERGLAGIPILAWTAHARQEERSRALESGCDAVATKPLEWAAFSRLLEGLLTRAAEKDEVIAQ